MSSEPAYPITGPQEEQYHYGLSKREILSGMAMQGLLAWSHNKSVLITVEQLVKKSIEHADTLLKELDE